MNPRRYLILVALASLALSGCGGEGAPAEKSAAKDEVKAGKAQAAKKEDEHGDEHGHEESAAVELSAAEIKAAGIKTQKLAWQASGGEIALTGVIQPNADRLAQVAGRVPGRVVRVQASLGDRVKPGQSLAVLDSIEVGEARSALAQALAELRVAEAAFQRAESLRAENIVPEKEYLRARGDAEKARATAAAAREKVKMLGVGAAAEADGASLFTVTAPFAGTIIEKTAVPGALSEPAKPLFTLADLSTVWIEANVFESDLPRVARGASASVTVSAWPGSPFKGRVTYIASVMDRETRTVRARVEVPNAEGRLRPGMFANVVIAVPSQASAKALRVPADAVVLMDGKPNVFVRGEHGFEAREVTTGARSGGSVELKDGVQAGEDVVVAGTYELKARIQKAQLGEGHAH